MLVIILLASVVVLNACFSESDERRSGVDFKQFEKYWYQGLAEVNTFDLQQYRYGEKRQGEAVLIFVTEDFSKSKQVKLDNPKQAGNDAVKVLKLNKTKKFVTGIYPYSMMLSAFTPVYETSASLKLTASSQEWCGHTFTQLNLQKSVAHEGKYNTKIFSYFEQEGDQELSITAMPEDDLWNLIRLNPATIPTGKASLIPGLLYQRLSHIPLKAEVAEISLSDAGSEVQELTVDYEDVNRILKISFNRAFPFEIIQWEERQTLEDGTEEVTTATRKAVKMIDYWTKNSNNDQSLRKELKL